MLCAMRLLVARVVGPVVAPGLALALLCGCGSAPERIDPTGIDSLTIPTPSPDPSDFTVRIDNRWLPLAPGTTWTYEVTGSARASTATTTVTDQTSTIAGVRTVVVRHETLGRRGRVLETTDSYYAQDRDGNVWIFGTTGPDGWRAGEDSAEATLAMADGPRHGDGYAAEFVGGAITRAAEVRATNATTYTPYGEFDDVVEVEETGVEEGAEPYVSSYAEGVGLVEVDRTGAEGLELVDVQR
ncbi:hypothetical protein ASD30_07350 [Nocardioides sp. Root140]|nr:hypothetical protein ASD30_07350 [Nocardioides sp. Root140]KRF12607.1 hypothetical protein ASH02_13705 [Nocardioides sp. Soil796]